MVDSADQNSGDIEGQTGGEERPLRWAPDEMSEQQRLSVAPPPSEPRGQSDELPPPPPQPLPSWEHLEEEGFASALFLTIKEVLFDPSATFSRMPREMALGRPLFFAVLLQTVAAMVGVFYQALWEMVFPSGQNPLQQIFQQMGINMPLPAGSEMVLLSLISIVLVPFFVIIWLFIWSGIVHLALMLVGGVNYGYEATFRTLCYVSGATAVLGLIPFCGVFPIAFVWSVVCSIIGLTQTQETSGGKATAAVLLPYLLCCCCIGAAIATLVAMFLPAIASGMR